MMSDGPRCMYFSPDIPATKIFSLLRPIKSSFPSLFTKFPPTLRLVVVFGKMENPFSNFILFSLTRVVLRDTGAFVNNSFNASIVNLFCPTSMAARFRGKINAFLNEQFFNVRVCNCVKLMNAFFSSFRPWFCDRSNSTVDREIPYGMAFNSFLTHSTFSAQHLHRMGHFAWTILRSATAKNNTNGNLQDILLAM